ncbi:hypothetical protein EVAR_79420_1 [Eumeta japonica]|uniref:Uncharacterized protein n=1 Tax=Eumeta variegata TaxID=151549 RepID=A0A4C1VGQ9_EUMVA|nr:hypothetical protein EVAR_79420_1 [Eumeta japonica]
MHSVKYHARLYIRNGRWHACSCVSLSQPRPILTRLRPISDVAALIGRSGCEGGRFFNSLSKHDRRRKHARAHEAAPKLRDRPPNNADAGGPRIQIWNYL